MTSKISEVFKHISIHAPRERSDGKTVEWVKFDVISIHAPRERSDIYAYKSATSTWISIHAPRERSDNSKKKFIFPW